jgi:hypothetical protein
VNEVCDYVKRKVRVQVSSFVTSRLNCFQEPWRMTRGGPDLPLVSYSYGLCDCLLSSKGNAVGEEDFSHNFGSLSSGDVVGHPKVRPRLSAAGFFCTSGGVGASAGVTTDSICLCQLLYPQVVGTGVGYVLEYTGTYQVTQTSGDSHPLGDLPTCAVYTWSEVGLVLSVTRLSRHSTAGIY